MYTHALAQAYMCINKVKIDFVNNLTKMLNLLCTIIIT